MFSFLVNFITLPFLSPLLPFSLPPPLTMMKKQEIQIIIVIIIIKRRKVKRFKNEA
jgi:hypothetical protein